MPTPEEEKQNQSIWGNLWNSLHHTATHSYPTPTGEAYQDTTKPDIDLNKVIEEAPENYRRWNSSGWIPPQTPDEGSFDAERARRDALASAQSLNPYLVTPSVEYEKLPSEYAQRVPPGYVPPQVGWQPTPEQIAQMQKYMVQGAPAQSAPPQTQSASPSSSPQAAPRRSGIINKTPVNQDDQQAKGTMAELLKREDALSMDDKMARAAMESLIQTGSAQAPGAAKKGKASKKGSTGSVQKPIADPINVLAAAAPKEAPALGELINAPSAQGVSPYAAYMLPSVDYAKEMREMGLLDRATMEARYNQAMDVHDDQRRQFLIGQLLGGALGATASSLINRGQPNFAQGAYDNLIPALAGTQAMLQRSHEGESRDTQAYQAALRQYYDSLMDFHKENSQITRGNQDAAVKLRTADMENAYRLRPQFGSEYNDDKGNRMVPRYDTVAGTATPVKIGPAEHRIDPYERSAMTQDRADRREGRKEVSALKKELRVYTEDLGNMTDLNKAAQKDASGDDFLAQWNKRNKSSYTREGAIRAIKENIAAVNKDIEDAERDMGRGPAKATGGGFTGRRASASAPQAGKSEKAKGFNHR